MAENRLILFPLFLSKERGGYLGKAKKGLESQFQSKLIKELKNTFDGCLVMKLDPTYLQGVPDLLILHNDRWAALECKRSEDAPHQPNQDYYVSKMDGMSFSRFVSPENKDRVMSELKEMFGS